MNIAEAADGYLRLYDRKKAIETELSQVNERLNAARDMLLAELSMSGLNAVGRGDRSITIHSSSFGKVVDFQFLRDWVENVSGEPVSQYMELTFIKGSTSDPRGIHAMIADAQEKAIDTGKTVEECLPPGLSFVTVPVVTVRQKSTRQNRTAVDRLDEEEF